MTGPAMMPGQQPYTPAELDQLRAVLTAAAEADPGEANEPPMDARVILADVSTDRLIYALADIHDALYPPAEPDAQWTPYTLDCIADAIANVMGPAPHPWPCASARVARCTNPDPNHSGPHRHGPGEWN